MLNGKEVYRSIVLTDDVQTAQLGIMDQLRLIIAKFSNDDAAELDVAEKLSGDKLRKISALYDFIDKATERMQVIGENSVTIKLSSEFLPYINDVLNDKHGYGRYYDFKLVKRDIPLAVKHFFILKISRKNT